MAEDYEAKKAELVDRWNDILVDRLLKAQQRYGIGITMYLFYSVQAELVRNGAEVSASKLSFNYYGKFLDMGVGRGQKIESVKGNRDLVTAIGGGRKPKKWLSKTYYAEIGILRDLMLEHSSEHILGVIKESFGQSIHINL